VIRDPATSTWHYVEDRLVPDLAEWRASLFTVGNGYLGTRGTFEEGFGDQEVATYIHGLFVIPPGETPVLAAAPDWSSVRITIDGEPLLLDERPPAGYHRTLDMARGLSTRTVVWRGLETGTVRLTFRRTASMVEPGLVGLDIRIEALTADVLVTIESGIDATIAGPDGPLWMPSSWQRTGSSSLELTANSVDGSHQLTARTWMHGLGAGRLVADDTHPRFGFEATIGNGAHVTFTKAAHYDHPAATPGFDPTDITVDRIITDSQPLWDARWATSRIDIVGDREAERAARFAAFHLIAASPPKDTAGSIGARLLSGYAYRHHVFWDTDIYVIPYLTVTQPDLAATHLRYRYRGLEAARRKAARFGRTGAFYPWEAADTGDEVAPLWVSTPDGSPIRIWTGEIEEHITACVAWAADHYHRWSGDDAFFAEMGSEIILEGARYWHSRFERENSGAHLRNVIGPNEYHVHVDDSYFTNALAAWQLRRAADLSDTEADRYRLLADEVTIHRRADGVIAEHARFLDLDEIDVASFWPAPASLRWLLGDERTREVQLVKQADVVLAQVLLRTSSDITSLEANFGYYAPRTDHGSSLSLSMHAFAAARLGRSDSAYEYLRRAVAIDHDDAMVRGGHGIHAAAQGGILQAIIFGFGGLDLHEGLATTSPSLPDSWESLGFSFVHNGEVNEVLVDQSTTKEGA